MFRSYLFAFFMLTLVPIADAQVVNRTLDGLETSIYELGSEKGELLYRGLYSVKVEGDYAMQRLEIRDTEGKLVGVEELAEKGGRFLSYSYRRLNADEGGVVKLEDGVLKFDYRRGEKKTEEELDLPERFVIGGMVVEHLRSRWDDVLAGEDIHINYGVLDRQDMYRFKLFKDGETEVDGKKAVVIKMKPATWLISLLVKPLYFFMSPDGKHVYELKGRTILLKEDNGDWEPLDGHTVYHHDRRKGN